MKQIIIIKPKSLSPKDKEKLTKDGNIVIEHEKSHEVIFKPLPQEPNHLEFVYTNCYKCGDRIYVTKERLEALKQKKGVFYCPQGHNQAFV